MAKKSMIARENKRLKMVEKFSKKRFELKSIINDVSKSEEEKDIAMKKLQKLPRDASPVRLQRRCQITGRPHGVYRKLKISRIALRQLGLQGKIPGMVKSSW